MIRAEQHEPVRENMLDAMREARARDRHAIAARRQRGQEPVVRDLAEDDDHPEPREKRQLLHEERPAARELARQRLVRALHRRIPLRACRHPNRSGGS